jgi:hypothetical protein
MTLPRSLLRPAQINVAQEIKTSTGLQLVAGMGSGKTISMLTALTDLLAEGTIQTAIIIAPVRVALHTWPKEIAEWEHTADLDFVVLSGTPAQRAAKLREKHQVYICSIDNLVWLIDELRKFGKDDPRWDMLVIDELSRFKSPRGERAKKLIRFVARFRAIIGLTGTPRPRSWEDQFTPIRIVSGDTAWGCGFDDWRKRYCMSLDFKGFKWEVREDAIPTIKRVIDEWTCTIPPDAASDVPFNFGPQFDTVTPLDKAQVADLESLQRDLLLELGISGADLKVDPGDDAMVAALSQAVASGKMTQILQGFLYRDGETVQTYKNAKLDALDDLLQGIDGENTLIAYFYKQELQDIKRLLGDIPVLGSETTDDEFVAHMAAWMAGDIPRMAIHPMSMGHGVDGLQKGGRRMIWYHPVWGGELFAQTCKRIARPGQKDPVFIHRIIADHWIDRLKVERVERSMTEEAEFIASLRRV